MTAFPLRFAISVHYESTHRFCIFFSQGDQDSLRHDPKRLQYNMVLLKVVSL